MNQDMPLIYPKIKGHAVGCEAQLSFLQYFVRKLKAKLLGWLEILSQAVFCSPEAGSANYCWIVKYLSRQGKKNRSNSCSSSYVQVINILFSYT